MKNLFLSLFLLSLFQGFSQKIRIKVLNQKDTTVHLIRYYGEKLYYADTAEMKNGQVVFEGSKQKPGIVGLFLPGQRYFEFIYNIDPVIINDHDATLQTPIAEYFIYILIIFFKNC